MTMAGADSGRESVHDTGEGFTVLVVEDEATHQMLIRKSLEHDESPFSLVQFTRDSQEAVRFARQMSFDVMLVDNRIPGTRGLDLLTELRETGVTAPFVLMTSAGSEDLVVQAYRQNVDDYVVKDSGFWKELPQVLQRVIRADRAKKREIELRARLERTNARLNAVQCQYQLKCERIRFLTSALAEAASGLEGPGAERIVSLIGEVEELTR